MWLNIAIGVIIIIALGVIALVSVYGGKIKVSVNKGEPQQPGGAGAALPEKKEPEFSPIKEQINLGLNFKPPKLPPIEEYWHPHYCYVVNFYEEHEQPMERFNEIKEALKTCDVKLYCLLGFDETAQQWKAAEMSSAYRYWAMLVPLADRAGALSNTRLERTQRECYRFAQKHKFNVATSSADGARERAALLDEFCNEVDIVLNLRVVLSSPVVASEMEELLQQAYIYRDGERYIYRLESEELFTVKILMLPNNTTQEVVFNLDVPRVSQPERAYEDMIRRMQEIAELKHGNLRDRSDAPLGNDDIVRMRGGVSTVATRMAEYGVMPGSELSHLLFS